MTAAPTPARRRPRGGTLPHREPGHLGVLVEMGTAGLRAMLAVRALEKEGLPRNSGQMVVAGAAGGVGWVATAVLSKVGYHVIASTGRLSEPDCLTSLGAAEVIDRNEL